MSKKFPPPCLLIVQNVRAHPSESSQNPAQDHLIPSIPSNNPQKQSTKIPKKLLSEINPDPQRVKSSSISSAPAPPAIYRPTPQKTRKKTANHPQKILKKSPRRQDRFTIHFIENSLLMMFFLFLQISCAGTPSIRWPRRGALPARPMDGSTGDSSTSRWLSTRLTVCLTLPL